MDLEIEAIVNAQVSTATRSDAETGVESVILAQLALSRSGSEAEVQELVADKGNHDNGFLAECATFEIRTYIAESKQAKRVWTNKSAEVQSAFRANRRRVRGDRGRRLKRCRSERVERTFAHVCETGGGRRTWLRGLINVQKAHLLRCCAYNLGLVMRKYFGMGKPRSGAAAAIVVLILFGAMARGITESNVPMEYLPWLIQYALAFLLLTLLARYTHRLLRLVRDIRGS